MEKNVSIVRVDTRHYRTIARENWGLTKEQMRGKHVHHRVRVSDGGTNDPSNLYVCSPSFHRWCWHDGEEFVEWAGQGASKAHAKKDSRGKSVTATKAGSSTHSEKDEDGKSLLMLKLHESKDSEGKSTLARKAAKASHSVKNEQGKSVNAVKNGRKTVKALNLVKNSEGKSLNAVKGAAKAHERKDERGKPISCVKGGKNSARLTNSQVWESIHDGFRSGPGQVACHNRANGWNPNDRIRIS
jgi:hypothetical protein